MPGSWTEQLAVARRHAERGRQAKALAAYAKLAALRPSDGLVHAELGEVYLRLGALTEALEAFKVAGSCYEKVGQGHKALFAWNRARLLINDRMQGRRGEHQELWKNLARLLEEEGRNQWAMEVLEELANDEEQAGRVKEGLSLRERMIAIDNATKSGSLLSLRATVNSGDVEAMRDCAKLLLQRGDVSEAKALMERALKRWDFLELHSLAAEVWMVQEGKLESIWVAIRHLQRVLAADPKNEKALELSARALRDVGQDQRSDEIVRYLQELRGERCASDAWTLQEETPADVPEDLPFATGETTGKTATFSASNTRTDELGRGSDAPDSSVRNRMPVRPGGVTLPPRPRMRTAGDFR